MVRALGLRIGGLGALVVDNVVREFGVRDIKCKHRGDCGYPNDGIVRMKAQAEH